MTYKLADGGIRRSDGAFIPADKSNTDYQEYLKWIADGNVPEPADPEPAIPKYVTKVTAYNRIESEYGDTKLNQLFDLLDSLPRKELRIYNDAQDIECSNATVIAALQSLSIDPAKILY